MTYLNGLYIIDKDGNKKKVVKHLAVANTVYKRMKGLIGSDGLQEGEGLLLYPCNSIHMFFMKFPIDVIYLDKDKNILHVTHNMQPWKVGRVIKNAYYVLELPANTVEFDWYNNKIEF